MADPLRVIYVDDEPGLLEIGKLFLEADGEFVVDTLASAKEALDHLVKERYDIIISDYKMPEMDGISFLKQLKSSGNTTPFIIFTGKGREEVVIEALNNGADFYIQKGGDPNAQFAELSNKIRYAVTRRSAEGTLSESQKRTAEIIEFFPDATFAINTNGVVIAWNRAMEIMTGIGKDEILGKGQQDYAVPFYGKRRPMLIDLVFSHDEIVKEEYPGIGKEGDKLFAEIFIPHFHNGSGAHLWFTASPLYNSAGKISGAIESIRDITVRTRAVQGLEESRRQLDAMATNIPGVIYRFFVNPDGTTGYDYISERSLQILGLDNDTAMFFDRFTRGVVPEERERFIRSVQDAIDTKTLWEFESQYTRPSGKKIWISVLASPVVEKGRLLFDGVIFDNSARRRAEEELIRKNEELNASYEQLSATEEEELRQNYEELAHQERTLRESEERFRALIQNSTDIIQIIDADGKIVFDSPSSGRILGYSPGFTIGKTPLEFIHPDDRKPVQEAISMGDAGKNPRTPTEFRVRKADGNYVYVESVALNLIGVPGIDGIVTTTRLIEERKKFDDALKKSEERFRGITERISDLVIITDLEGIPTYFSPSITTILGYSPDYYTGVNTHPEIFAKEDIIKIERAIKLLKEGSPEEQVEFRMKKTEGSYAIFDGIGRPVFEGDTCTGVQIIARDITRRKSAENSLRIQHDLILELNRCNSLDDACNRILTATQQIEGIDSGGIYITDPISGALDLLVSSGLSPAFVQYVSHFGQNDPQVIWAKAGVPFYGKFVDIRQPGPDAIRDQEGIISAACIPVLHDRNLIALVNVVSHTMDNIPDTARQTLETLASQVGSTVNRIRSRMKLLESEERYRSLVENLNDAVFTVDHDGLITYVSQAGERQYGYTSSDLIGKPFTNIVYKEDIPALLDRFYNIGKGLVTPFEWRLLHQDGSLSWVRTSTRPVEDSTGSSSFFGIISNISQQKKDEEVIRQANRKLSLLTGITRHDINNQLMVLNGFLQLLHNKVQGPALEDYFTRINRVSARISSIIQFTKEYEDIGVSDPTWQDCHVLVDEAAEDAPLGTLRVKNDLPSGAEIFADPLISKVFYNLMDNAVRYGGTITTIRFSSEQRGSDHILFCEDDGAGIPIDEKEKIFDRGYGKNTGLGLALSREILSITGITITETGEPGRGSRFEMVVPAGMWRLGGPDTTGV